MVESEKAPQHKRAFIQKFVYFHAQESMHVIQGPGILHCAIVVRRKNILEDAFEQVMRMSPLELRRKLVIKFQDEEGLDYGGVSR